MCEVVPIALPELKAKACHRVAAFVSGSGKAMGTTSHIKKNEFRPTEEFGAVQDSKGIHAPQHASTRFKRYI